LLQKYVQSEAKPNVDGLNNLQRRWTFKSDWCVDNFSQRFGKYERISEVIERNLQHLARFSLVILDEHILEESNFEEVFKGEILILNTGAALINHDCICFRSRNEKAF